MTLEELKQYDGKDGRPAYIGYKGKVYDLSNSDFWTGGVHMGTVQAGTDTTEKIGLSPHGELNIFKFPVVAELEAEKTAEAATPTVYTKEEETQIRRMKLYRKYHPHPIMVHFPMGIIPFAFFAQIIGFFCPLGVYFTFASVTAMILGTLFLIPAIASGTLSFVINYNKTANVYLKRKIVLSTIALILGIFSSIYGYMYILRAFYQPSGLGGGFCIPFGGNSCVYTLLTAIMMGIVIAIGYNGGKMTWPDDK